jgi:hypothetical protein
MIAGNICYAAVAAQIQSGNMRISGSIEKKL